MGRVYSMNRKKRTEFKYWNERQEKMNHYEDQNING
jgi:hypothetical protein